MMPEMLTDLGITKVNIGLVNILIDDKHIMFVINLKPTNKAHKCGLLLFEGYP